MSKRPELHIPWFRCFWASPRVLGLNRGGRPRKPYACYGCGTESRKKTTKQRQISLLACPWKYLCWPARGSIVVDRPLAVSLVPCPLKYQCWPTRGSIFVGLPVEVSLLACPWEYRCCVACPRKYRCCGLCP